MTSGAELASWLNDTELASEYAANASTLKSTFNAAFWVADRGLYRDNDNETTTLFAQDGNSLAVVFNLTESADQAAAISDGLTENWSVYGSVSPELPDTISPFIGGFEVCSISCICLEIVVTMGITDTSTLHCWKRRTRARSSASRMGIHALHTHQRAVDSAGRLHVQWIALVRTAFSHPTFV